ncbi:MAG TPA: hypothetical protein VGE76_02340 [Opitutaceae bacterium]
MKAGTLLRIGIYLVGLCWLISGVSSAVYYAHSAFSGITTDLYGRDPSAGMVYGYAVAPLLFALLSFAFGGRLSRGLLGAAAQEVIGAATPQVTRVLTKVLGLYLLGTYGGHLAATFYELMALGPANPSLSKVQVTSDLIANGVGVAFAVWFAFRTDSVVRLVMREE